MTSKITLITPPDIYENENQSVLFIHLSDTDQDITSKWLSTNGFKNNLNFYVYNDESDVKWLLWAIGCCQHKYIDLDRINEITAILCGYMLGKHEFSYKISNENIAAVCNYINCNRVRNIEDFLKRAFGEQTS